MSKKTGYGMALAACFMVFLFSVQPGFGAEDEVPWDGGIDMDHPDPPPDPDFPNTDNLDPDNDGVSNRWDNCADVSNKNQSDKDKDGIGDACDDFDDIYHRLLNQYIQQQIQDRCMEAAKSYPEDTDRDGIMDACDRTDNNGPCQRFMTAGGKRNFPLEPAYAVYEDTDVCYNYINACAIPSWMTQQPTACPREDISGFRYRDR